MDPLQTLKHEHGLIRQALDNITLAKEDMENGNRPPVEFFQKAVEFFRTVVFKLHHFKEEHVMFGLLAQKKKGEMDAQIEALNNQHNHGRNMISEISNALKGYSEGKNIPTEKLMDNISQYASMLRKHMQTEDYILYPMVAETLTDEEMQALALEFEKEDAKNDANNMDKGRALVNEMGLILIR